MDFETPDFRDERLKAFTVCSLIESKKVSAPKKRVCLEAKRDDKVWVRVIVEKFPAKPSACHVHVDMCRESSFKKDSIPTANAKIPDIMAALEKYAGQRIESFVKSSFAIEKKKLPADGVVSLLSQVTAGPSETGLRLSGGTFDVEQGPVLSIEWKIRKRDRKEIVSCVIESEYEGQIDPKYLTEAFAPAIRALKTFILDERESTLHA